MFVGSEDLVNRSCLGYLGCLEVPSAYLVLLNKIFRCIPKQQKEKGCAWGSLNEGLFCGPVAVSAEMRIFLEVQNEQS